MSLELIPEVLPEEKRLPLWDHVGELRDRLINCALALFLATACGYVLRFRLWDLAKRPLLKAAPSLLSPFAYTDLAEPFISMMRLSFWTSVFVISPYLFYQVWAFVRPALRERERRMAVTFTAVTSACFVAGAVFAYFVAFPILTNILMDEAVQAGLRPNLKPTEYLNLFLCTVLGTGVAFEAPVLFYFLARFGLVSSRLMLKYWREATIGILFASAFLTPGDVIATTILFGVVLLGLYFVSAGVVWIVERSSAAGPSSEI
ncbi:MAG: twin-arginine translocase subunit TatC [Elusimicrobia bacterium]|nr:twin-arginine translocase subunit TatC [Elusimicrobiota bacterium]